MARQSRRVDPPAQPVPGSEKQLVGRRVLAPLEYWLQHLHELPTHGNRNLLADHVLVAHLVAFLIPALKSLRRIEAGFEHRVARERFGLPRIPKSTLADAQAIFNPALLEPIIADLRQRVPHLPHDPKLDAPLKTLTAVDGSFFRWLKCLVNFQHFFSEPPDGLPLQIGAAVIGTLLLALIIQDRPSSYDWAIMASVVGGLLPLDQETLEIMAHRRLERARAANWQKEYRARKRSG